MPFGGRVGETFSSIWLRDESALFLVGALDDSFLLLLCVSPRLADRLLQIEVGSFEVRLEAADDDSPLLLLFAAADDDSALCLPFAAADDDDPALCSFSPAADDEPALCLPLLPALVTSLTWLT